LATKKEKERKRGRWNGAQGPTLQVSYLFFYLILPVDKRKEETEERTLAPSIFTTIGHCRSGQW